MLLFSEAFALLCFSLQNSKSGPQTSRTERQRRACCPSNHPASHPASSQAPLRHSLPLQAAECLTEGRRGEAHTDLKSTKSSKIPSARNATVSATAITTSFLSSRDDGSCPASRITRAQAPAQPESSTGRSHRDMESKATSLVFHPRLYIRQKLSWGRRSRCFLGVIPSVVDPVSLTASGTDRVW